MENIITDVSFDDFYEKLTRFLQKVATFLGDFTYNGCIGINTYTMVLYVRICKKLPPQRGYYMFLNRKNTTGITAQSPETFHFEPTERRMAVERERERGVRPALNIHPVLCLTLKKRRTG